MWDDLESEILDLFFGQNEQRTLIAFERWASSRRLRRWKRDRLRDRRAYMRDYDRRPEVVARVKEYNQTPKRKAAKTAAAKMWRLKNLERARADDRERKARARAVRKQNDMGRDRKGRDRV